MASSSPQGWSVVGGGGQPGRLHRLYQFGLCLLGFVLLGIVVYSIAPTLPRYLHIDEQINTIKDRDIRAGAIFYSEIEQMPAIESMIRPAVHGNQSKEWTASVHGPTDR